MRVILVNECERDRVILAERLRAQGYLVEVAPDAASGASMTLAAPPNAVIADLWMNSISGVQLCRLLRSEPGTAEVPVILRAEDEPRNRFWAERAGAAFVRKGRMGELVRTLAREAKEHEDDGFFVQLAGDVMDIRDRIAGHLDAALFDSVIAAEVRSLANCGAFDRFFDLFSQFVAQVTSYRWLALYIYAPERLGLHANPAMSSQCIQEARKHMKTDESVDMVLVEDEDANAESEGPEPIWADISFGNLRLGQVALAVCSGNKQEEDKHLINVIATELGGPLRMTTLIEESRRMATTDSLTSLLNRRAFIEALSELLTYSRNRSRALSLLLFDIDHFKQVNDTRGHAGGDLVLAAVGKLLRNFARQNDLIARWGGEEFVLSLPEADKALGYELAENLRLSIEALDIKDANGDKIPVTASVGLAVLRPNDNLDKLIDRADRAMYMAKSGGRNQVATDEQLEAAESEHQASVA